MREDLTLTEKIIDISDLDVVYLSYDEPQANHFWAKIRSQIPWAMRIHGVKGSDEAHKEAARAVNTERFILIDGDNLPDWSFFSQQLRITEQNKNKVFRWRAYNHINGLCYGNGGLSCWTRDFVLNMKTHEHTDGSDETSVEFCFDNDYWAMHDCYSTTYPDGSRYQAWRAGFREGVKMCLDRGKRVTPEYFEKDTWMGNRYNLEIWCSVGNDVDYGDWAIMGARYGAYKVMFDTDWDYTEVRDFDKLINIYENFEDSYIEDYDTALTNRLGLDIVYLSSEQSKWYKAHQTPHQNIDIMLPEHDYRRILHDAARQSGR